MQEEANFDLGDELQKNDLITEVLAIIDLDPLIREQERNRISDEYNVRKSVIDEFIKQAKREDETVGRTTVFSDVEPAAERISGDKLLSTIKEVLSKHVILPGGVAVAIAAWVVLTYCY